MRWCDVAAATSILTELVRLLTARKEQTAEDAARRIHERAIKLHAERRARVHK